MIDIHTHLLPSVDDGSKSIEETRALIKEAIQDGISDICLTPHFSRVDGYLYKKDELLKAFNNLKEELKDLNINIYLGNEIMIERDVDNLIENNKLCTINNSKYVLIEFPLDEYKKEYDDYLYDIKSLNLKIIIAHPERYSFINDDIIDSWINSGYYLQANASSLNRKETRKLLFKLIEEGKISLFASDSHNKHRPCILSSAYKLIEKNFNKEISDVLFNINPYNILNDVNLVKLNKVKKKRFVL